METHDEKSLTEKVTSLLSTHEMGVDELIGRIFECDPQAISDRLLASYRKRIIKAMSRARKWGVVFEKRITYRAL